MFIEMKHTPIAYSDALETAVTVEEAMIRDRDGGFGVVNKTAVEIKPHTHPLGAL
jgi:hypothetical protein